MKQEDIKFVYEIHSSLDLDDVLDELHEELKLEKGVIRYFSLSQDDLIEEELPINELKQKAEDTFSEDEYPTLIFQDIEISVDENDIEIVSKIRLKLENIDVDKVIEN